MDQSFLPRALSGFVGRSFSPVIDCSSADVADGSQKAHPKDSGIIVPAVRKKVTQQNRKKRRGVAKEQKIQRESTARKAECNEGDGERENSVRHHP